MSSAQVSSEILREKYDVNLLRSSLTLCIYNMLSLSLSLSLTLSPPLKNVNGFFVCHVQLDQSTYAKSVQTSIVFFPSICFVFV